MKPRTKLKLAELTASISLIVALCMIFHAMYSESTSQEFFYVTLLVWFVFIISTYFVFHFWLEIESNNKKYW